MNDPQLDRILIEGLKAECVIGVGDDERRYPQQVMVDIALHADVSAAARSDDLSDTVDYSTLSRSVVESVRQSRFHLIEALAQHVADLCLAMDRVRVVVVTVRKPGALSAAEHAGIQITRRASR